MNKNHESYNYMKHITEQLFLMKTNTDFSYPLSDYVRGYKNVISHPMDLMTVKNKLTKGVYKTTREWYNDVCLIYDNCLKYHSQSDDKYVAELYITLAKYNLSEFKKMTLGLGYENDKEWNALVKKSKDKLMNLIKDCPLDLDVKSQMIDVSGDIDLELSKQEIKEVTETLNKWLSSDDDDENAKRRSDIFRILRETEEDLDMGKEELVIDAAELKPSTLNTLWTYVKTSEI